MALLLRSLFAAWLVLAPAHAATEVRIPMVTPAGQHLSLEGRVYDQGDGRRHPAIILSHGSPREGRQRRDPQYGNFVRQAEWFQAQGFVVVAAKRRGFGTSEGEFVELSGPCERRDYRASGLTSANDIQAAVAYARGLPSVDPARIVLLGQSAGGWGSLALASRQPEGVVAVVNFAGGRGSRGDNDNCDVDDLVRSAGGFGRTTTVPSIWLYAENDLFIPPAVSRRMFEAYRAETKADARYIALPAFGRDGHATFGSHDAAGNWQATVRRFLEAVTR